MKAFFKMLRAQAIWLCGHFRTPKPNPKRRLIK